VSDGAVSLRDLVDEVRGVESSVLEPVGLRLPSAVLEVLAGVPGKEVPCRHALLHGDYVPSNLILADPDQVAMIDPVLARVGLPEDDLARFLAILASDTVFVPGLVVPPVGRLRRDLEQVFCRAYDPASPSTALLELRLIKQHALRWRRRRDWSKLARHSLVMRARQRVVDRHMRALLDESGQRLSRALGAP
jgi:hypothetical protein